MLTERGLAEYILHSERCVRASTPMHTRARHADGHAQRDFFLKQPRGHLQLSRVRNRCVPSSALTPRIHVPRFVSIWLWATVCGRRIHSSNNEWRLLLELAAIALATGTTSAVSFPWAAGCSRRLCNLPCVRIGSGVVRAGGGAACERDR